MRTRMAPESPRFGCLVLCKHSAHLIALNSPVMMSTLDRCVAVSLLSTALLTDFLGGGSPSVGGRRRPR